MEFSEKTIIKNGETKKIFKIDNKEVTQHAYDSMFEEQIGQSEGVNNKETFDEKMSDDFYDLVETIKNSDEEEIIDILEEEFNFGYNIGYHNAQVNLFSDLSKEFLRKSILLENR
ncbi:MAG: hypothetical protein ACOCUI_03035 [bacterium]